MTFFSNPTLLNHHFDEAPKRIKAGRLCCGVLDWGGFGATCLGHKLWWYFNCSEFELLKEFSERSAEWRTTSDNRRCPRWRLWPDGRLTENLVPGELSGVFADFRGLVPPGGLGGCARRSVGFCFEIKQWVFQVYRSTGRFSMVCLFGNFESGFLGLLIRHKWCLITVII